MSKRRKPQPLFQFSDGKTTTWVNLAAVLGCMRAAPMQGNHDGELMVHVASGIMYKVPADQVNAFLNALADYWGM